MYEIIPGILEKEWSAVEKKIEMVKSFAKTIHVDLLDGKFAPNTTILDPAPFIKYSNDIFFELHMMVDDPEQYIEPFANAGFKRFMGHVEQMFDLPSFVAKAQLFGEVGIYIDGPTTLQPAELPLSALDTIGIFTASKAGFSGQRFEASMLQKVKTVRGQEVLTAKGFPLPIEVDGGINEQTLPLAKRAGATRFVATSYIFTGDPKTQYDTLVGLCAE